MTDPTPRITDDEVASLPVHAGRAELLEDLMDTPLDHAEKSTTRHRLTPAWLAAPAAAAAIAAIVLVPALRGSDDPSGAGPAGGTASTSTSQPADTSYVVLGAAGWDVTSVGEMDGLLSVQLEKGPLSMELTEYPAQLHQQYLDDRLQVSTPRETPLLGLASTTVTYSAKNHATLRPAEGDSFLEVRADGMGLEAYEQLLAELEKTDAEGFARTVPEGTVTPESRDGDVARLLEGVQVPDGFTDEDIELSGFNDAYNAMTAVAGAVGCAWLDAYDAGDAAARQEALAALDGSVDWPLLRDQAAAGGYADAMWTVPDYLRDGSTGADLKPGIC